MLVSLCADDISKVLNNYLVCCNLPRCQPKIRSNDVTLWVSVAILYTVAILYVVPGFVMVDQRISFFLIVVGVAICIDGFKFGNRDNEGNGEYCA